MEGSAEPVSLMMKGAEEGDVEKIRIRRIIFSLFFLEDVRKLDSQNSFWFLLCQVKGWL